MSVWNGLPVRSSYFEDYHWFLKLQNRPAKIQSWLESARWHHCCWFLTQQRHRCVTRSGGCCFSYSRFWGSLAWKTEQGGNFHFEQKNSFSSAYMPVPFHVHPFPQLSQNKRSTPQTVGGKNSKTLQLLQKNILTQQDILEERHGWGHYALILPKVLVFCPSSPWQAAGKLKDAAQIWHSQEGFSAPQLKQCVGSIR